MISGKTVLTVLLGTALTLFIAILVLDASQPSASLPDRMKRECEAQFSSMGQVAVNDCVIKLMIRWSAEKQHDRMDTAYQRSR